MPSVDVTHFSDPGCPWAYSASPALAVLRWRYGDQLRWRLTLVGLTESADQYERRGYTTEGSALGRTVFRRYGMPLSPTPKRRVAATSCVVSPSGNAASSSAGSSGGSRRSRSGARLASTTS